jgi:hypothetical protein
VTLQISSISCVNMADLEVRITVITPESGGDVEIHNNRYVSADHPTCEAPRADTVYWLCRDVVTVLGIQTTWETNVQVYVHTKTTTNPEWVTGTWTYQLKHSTLINEPD